MVSPATNGRNCQKLSPCPTRRRPCTPCATVEATRSAATRSGGRRAPSASARRAPMAEREAAPGELAKGGKPGRLGGLGRLGYTQDFAPSPPPTPLPQGEGEKCKLMLHASRSTRRSITS